MTEILLSQLQRLRPAVVYCQDMHIMSADLLKAIRPHCELIVGQIASPAKDLPIEEYDVIISSFPHFVRHFRSKGITSFYQPLAFDKRTVSAISLGGYSERSIDVSFVGGISTDHGKRVELLELLALETPIQFYGYGSEALPSGSPIAARHRGDVWGHEMFAKLANSKITLNYHVDVAEQFANNMRLFEATGCGALLITDYKDNLADLFEIGTEVVAYRSFEEAAALIQYYAANPDEAEQIAIRGQQRTLQEHSYHKRMKHTAEILQRQLHRKRKVRTFAHPPPENVSYGHTVIQDETAINNLVDGWKEPEIPARQRGVVEEELRNMYRGDPPVVFRTLVQSVSQIVRQGHSLLEIGCSSGYYYEVLDYLLYKKVRYVGVDYSEAMIQLAQELYPGVEFHVADGAQLPFSNSSFDIVVSSCVLLHVPEYKQHIIEAARVAHNFLIAHRTPVCRKGRTTHHKKFAYGVETVELIFEEAEILNLFSNAGFQLIDSIEYESDTEHDRYELTYLFRSKITQ